MRIEGSRVLVTGGLGFIGSHVVDALVRAGASVRILDNYRTGLEENIAAVRNEVELIRGDILDKEVLQDCLVGVDAVSHHAAQLEITRAIADPVEDLTTNTIGTLNVFIACAEAGIDRIVQATSAGVYGQAISLPQDEDTHPTEPNWAYGVSKLANEKYASIFHAVHGLQITSLRYGIVYGPREWFGRVLTVFLRRALDREPIVIFGDGSQVRDFVYVDDVVDHNLRCFCEDKSANQIFNVSTGIGTTIVDLASAVIEVTGVDVPPIYDDVPEGQVSQFVDRQRLPQELKQLVQSPAKSHAVLDWEPTTMLRDGLRAEWEWLRGCPNRWTTMSY
jgi:UDP-glucose 4-epimerase